MEKIAITEINKNGKRYEIQDKGVRELLEKSDAELKRQGEQLSALDTDFQTYKNGHAESEMQVMAQLNNAMEIAANIANNARDSADQAAGSAESAAMSAENALTSAQQALDDSENALSYANAAKTYSEQANTYGNKAAESASLAVTKASEALEISQEIDKQATELNASIAQSKAEIDEKVSNASSSAAAASSSASAAAGSATDASTSASKAATSESNSKKSADNASASATTAQNAATVAQSAASDAESSVASVTEEISALSKDIAQNFQISTIQPTATGDTVSLSDSAEYPIQELHLFGKSTQNGTPTPDNPVDIVNVENPAVTVCGKNIANIAKGDINYATGENVPSDTAYRLENFVKNDTCMLTLIDGNQESMTANLRLYDENFNYLGYATLALKKNTPVKFRIANEKVKYLRFRCTTNKLTVQIELGDIGTDYEPYKEQTASITATLSDGDSVVVNASEAYIKRADGTQETLPEETVTAIRALHTYKPNTVVTADGAGVAVKYVADPTLYIDNKYAELASAIIASASEAE